MWTEPLFLTAKAVDIIINTAASGGINVMTQHTDQTRFVLSENCMNYI